MNDKVSLNCSGTERKEVRWGGGGGGEQDTEGGMGSAERRGYLIVSDGQKGGTAWTIPEQSGWYRDGGGGGGGEGFGLQATSSKYRRQPCSQ